MQRPAAALILALAAAALAQQTAPPRPEPWQLSARQVGDGFVFTEGPALDPQGRVWFTDVHANRIYRWDSNTPDRPARLLIENTARCNGLAFDRAGRLIACQGDTGRVVAYDPNHPDVPPTTIADAYNGQRFNQPNDLWIHPTGRIYFTDPVYGGAQVVQDGEHVYCIDPAARTVTRVIDDMTRPNGLIGTPDGNTLYVADLGARQTFRYRIEPDGSLSEKTLFASIGSDGMTIDHHGNVYFTTDAVHVLNPQGQRIGRIQAPKRPANVCFIDPAHTQLFITAQTTIATANLPETKENTHPTPPPSQ